MKRTLFALLFLFSLSAFAFAQSTDEQTILKLDEEFRAALLKSDMATLERLTDSNLQDYNQFGQNFDRADFLTVFKTFKPRLTYSGIKVRLAGNTAAVTGFIRELSTSNFGKDQFLQFIHVWANRADGWKLFIKQQQFDVKEGTVTPAGWNGQSNDNFLVGLDTEIKHGGTASAFIKSKYAEGGRALSAGLAQTIKADAYRGKRLRLSGYVKGSVAYGVAFPWLRVNAEHDQGEILSFDNRLSDGFYVRPDWYQFAIVLDVPEQAAVINLGFAFNGRGHVWLDDWTLETVEKSVPATNQASSEAARQRLELMNKTTQGQQIREANKKRLPTLPTAPANLDFETAGKP